jgi:2-C-methyl-D-erythritol 4-phosphate cytidylyltransferase/2-C-methyl-D-erythritol 2,4-cyclodiphosphate synthase
MKTSVIICAAGKGQRAGFGKNKLLHPLHGAPALYATLEKFAIPAIGETVVTSSKEDYEEISALCAPFGATVVLGGETRTESVFNALQAVTGDIVLIHDGARPYVTTQLIEGCIASVKQFRSGICAVAVTDTIAATNGGKICEVPPRSSLCAIQTPQGFYTRDIKSAYEKAMQTDEIFTDDSSVYRRFVAQPHLCEGDIANKKLTYSSDFSEDFPSICPQTSTINEQKSPKITQNLPKTTQEIPQTAQNLRIGFGVDVHAFGKNIPYVTLAGVQIPCDCGLIAHSDGDVLVHAVMDALLSAASLADIGHYFPDTDDKWKDACSIEMLKEVVNLVAAQGFAPQQVSVSVQAEKPRLAKHIEGMKANLASVLQISTQNIAVAAGTCEHLGFVGKGLGIAAYCVCTLAPIR